MLRAIKTEFVEGDRPAVDLDGGGWLFGAPAVVGRDAEDLEREALVGAETAGLDRIAANWKRRNRPKVTKVSDLKIEFSREEIDGMVKAIADGLEERGRTLAAALTWASMRPLPSTPRVIVGHNATATFYVPPIPAGWCTPSRNPVTGGEPHRFQNHERRWNDPD